MIRFKSTLKTKKYLEEVQGEIFINFKVCVSIQFDRIVMAVIIAILKNFMVVIMESTMIMDVTATN